MWVTAVATSIRLANVRNNGLGALNFDLERRKQRILGFDRYCLGPRPEL